MHSRLPETSGGYVPLSLFPSAMIHDLYRLAFRLWRVRRFQWFLDAVKPGPGCSVVDVGGYWWNWYERAPAFGSVLCVNPGEAGEIDGARLPNVSQVMGDGCALSYPDGSFDIAFSNSVIEHVGGPAKQAAFAAEVRRIGRKVWIQTPALECPFEPHLLCLGLHCPQGPGSTVLTPRPSRISSTTPVFCRVGNSDPSSRTAGFSRNASSGFFRSPTSPFGNDGVHRGCVRMRCPSGLPTRRTLSEFHGRTGPSARA